MHLRGTMRRVGDVTVDESTGSFYDLRFYTDQYVHIPGFISSSRERDAQAGWTPSTTASCVWVADLRCVIKTFPDSFSARDVYCAQAV
jgi:hypothetical protein